MATRNEFKRSLNGKTENELMEIALELEAGIRDCIQRQKTGQGKHEVKVNGKEYNIWISSKDKSMGWVNAGTFHNFKKMRAVVLTRMSEKQRLK
jgi:hypothetical protein